MNHNEISKNNLSIPNHWGMMKVKRLFTVKKELSTEVSPTILSLSRTAVKVRDISTGEGQIAASYDNYNSVNIGDLLLNPMDLTSGANCNVSYIKGIISPAYINLQAKSEVSSRFYDYFFKTQYWNNSFFVHGKGVSYENRWTLNNETLLNYFIPVPSYHEQKKIAYFLDKKITKIDNEILETQNLLDKLSEWNKTKTSDFFLKYSDASIKLKYLVKSPLQYGANESGINYSSKLPRYIRITDIDVDGCLRNTGKQSLNIAVAEGYMLKKYDILLARSGGTVGKSFIFNEEYNAAFAGYLIKASLDEEKLLPKLFYYFTKSSMYDIWKSNILNKSTIENIGASKYGELKVPIPAIGEQQKILDILDKQDNNYRSLSQVYMKKIELLKEYKRVLINDAVTGKIKIGDEYVK